MKDKIESFWVVTRPKAGSTLDDILFVSSPKGIGKHFLGGLQPDEIVGFYLTEEAAHRIALAMLERGVLR